LPPAASSGRIPFPQRPRLGQSPSTRAGATMALTPSGTFELLQPAEPSRMCWASHVDSHWIWPAAGLVLDAICGLPRGATRTSWCCVSEEIHTQSLGASFDSCIFGRDVVHLESEVNEKQTCKQPVPRLRGLWNRRPSCPLPPTRR
jgi:hypothetical protein